MAGCVSLDQRFDVFPVSGPVFQQTEVAEEPAAHAATANPAQAPDAFRRAPMDMRVTVQAEGLPPGVGIAIDSEEGVPVMVVEDEAALDTMLAALSGTAEAAEKGQTKAKGTTSDEDLTYKVNKLTKLAWRIGFAAAYVPYSQKYYLNYYASWLEDPNAVFFKGDPWLSKNLFNTKSPLGRTMRRLYLPEKYRKMTDAELHAHAGEIRLRGYRAQALSSSLMMGSNLVRIAGNVGALGNCAFGDGECDGSTVALVASDVTTSGIFGVVQHFAKKGSKLTKKAEMFSGAENLLYRGKAYDAFRFYKQLSRWGYTAQVATGAIRLSIEFDKWQHDDPTMSVAQSVDASADIADGTARVAYQTFLVREAAKVMKAAAVKAATATEATSVAGMAAAFKKGADFLAVSQPVIPNVIKIPMQTFGVVGGALGFGKSAMSFAEGAAGWKIGFDWSDGFSQGTELSGHDRTHLVISGGVGAVSAGLFIASSIFITPVGLVVGTPLALVAMGLLIGQIVYDMFDPLEIEKRLAEQAKELPPEGMGTLGESPQPLYEFPAGDATVRIEPFDDGKGWSAHKMVPGAVYLDASGRVFMQPALDIELPAEYPGTNRKKR